jgi:trimeric autotransporter adhesin
VQNSFFGTSAGASNTIANNNSFFGHGAGGLNTSGGANTFIGINSGQINSSGNNNVFVGADAGNSNLTGSNLTIVGTLANVGPNNLNFATAIGAGATVSTSNTIVLGRSNGGDLVLVPGLLQANNLGTAGATTLCRNASNQIATCSSSLRYKSNVRNFSPGLDLIRKLRPVSFNWKDGGMLDIGLVAEEVNAAEPLLTTTNSKGEVEGVKYDRVGVVLINAVNEQQSEIDRQGDELIKLRAEVALLKAFICSQSPSAEICGPKK